jgi:LacI family transcriptional regulator
MSELTSKQVTLHDVAERAGVSHQTVSRVINEHPNVSNGTRRRVLRAIKELNYKPNRAARSLVTNRSHTLGVMCLGISHYGLFRTTASVEQTAKALGYNIQSESIIDPTIELIHETIQHLTSWMVDGIILIAPSLDFVQKEVVQLMGDIPFVQIRAQIGVPNHSVVIDQHKGGQIITEHLLALGHRHIGEISGPLDWFDARARHQAWESALHNAGLEPGPSLEGRWTSESGYNLIRQLLKLDDQCTAVVVGNDEMALGVLCALHEDGIRVPNDMSIVGFDDIPEAAYFAPPLTTIRQDYEEIGKQSVEYLVDIINNPKMLPHQRVLQPVLIERKSTRRLV